MAAGRVLGLLFVLFIASRQACVVQAAEEEEDEKYVDTLMCGPGGRYSKTVDASVIETCRWDMKILATEDEDEVCRSSGLGGYAIDEDGAPIGRHRRDDDGGRYGDRGSGRGGKDDDDDDEGARRTVICYAKNFTKPTEEKDPYRTEFKRMCNKLNGGYSPMSCKRLWYYFRVYETEALAGMCEGDETGEAYYAEHAADMAAIREHASVAMTQCCEYNTEDSSSDEQKQKVCADYDWEKDEDWDYDDMEKLVEQVEAWERDEWEELWGSRKDDPDEIEDELWGLRVSDNDDDDDDDDDDHKDDDDDDEGIIPMDMLKLGVIAMTVVSVLGMVSYVYVQRARARAVTASAIPIAVTAVPVEGLPVEGYCPSAPVCGVPQVGSE